MNMNEADAATRAEREADAATRAQGVSSPSPARPSRGRARAVVAFLTGFVTALVVAGAVLWAVRSMWFVAPRIDTSRPTVVQQVQRLQRLETVVFGMDKIVAGGQESRFLPSLLAGDRLLLLVYGEATAGVDLAGVAAGDVVVAGTSVRITLPPAQIFSTRIDSERTRVYSRQTGLFSSVDPNLESEVRRVAEQQVTQAALDQGILRLASANAAATLTNLLRGLGFTQVDVR